jgi:hypothetical protein
MQSAALERAFQEVADALGSSDDESCVVVWPATAEGLADEFQVLTEKQWRLLLRVGLRLEPGADVRELYCFRDVPADDGLTVRVLRLAQESHTRTLRSGELWRVQKGPPVVRSRADVKGEIARSESEGNEAMVTATPPRLHVANGVALRTISPEEVKRKRRRFDADEGSGDDPMDTADEVRPPKKTRRLSGKGASRRAPVAATPLPARHSTVVAKDGDAERSEEMMSASTKSVAGFVPVIDGTESSSSADLSDKSTTESASSDGEEGKATDPEEESRRAENSPQSRDERDAFSFVLKKIAAAGMGNDEDDAGGTDYSSRTQAQAATRSTGAASLLWSIVEGASRHVHKVLTESCGLSSVLSATAAQDSADYDLMWVEEGKERWTMFGEPSPGRKRMKMRSQGREQRSPCSKWKFW